MDYVDDNVLTVMFLRGNKQRGSWEWGVYECTGHVE